MSDTNTTPSSSSSPSSPSIGSKVVAAAESMVGKYPYSWGGGDNDGATVGIIQKIPPYCDDRNVVGFDCSGLAKYAVYQGSGVSIIHKAQIQYDNAPTKVPLDEKQPGDLVFFGKSTTSITHVAIYAGDDMMIEASGHNDDLSGIPVRKVELRTNNIISSAARYW